MDVVILDHRHAHARALVTGSAGPVRLHSRPGTGHGGRPLTLQPERLDRGQLGQRLHAIGRHVDVHQRRDGRRVPDAAAECLDLGAQAVDGRSQGGVACLGQLGADCAGRHEVVDDRPVAVPGQLGVAGLDRGLRCGDVHRQPHADRDRGGRGGVGHPRARPSRLDRGLQLGVSLALQCRAGLVGGLELLRAQAPHRPPNRRRHRDRRRARPPSAGRRTCRPIGPRHQEPMRCARRRACSRWETHRASRQGGEHQRQRRVRPQRRAGLAARRSRRAPRRAPWPNHGSNDAGGGAASASQSMYDAVRQCGTAWAPSVARGRSDRNDPSV